MKYAGFLIEKVKFLYTYQDAVDGSYAPTIQLLPDRPPVQKSPLQFDLIKSLVELWRNSTSLHTLLLEQPKTIWNVRLGAALAVAQEEHAIISLLAHIVKVFKSLPYEEVEREIHNAQYFVNTLTEEFSMNYARSNKYINTLRLVPELSERSDMIPVLPIGLDTYLRSYKPEVPARIGEIKEMFNSRNEIMGLRVPQCISSPPPALPEVDDPMSSNSSRFAASARENDVPMLRADWGTRLRNNESQAEENQGALGSDSEGAADPQCLVRRDYRPSSVIIPAPARSSVLALERPPPSVRLAENAQQAPEEEKATNNQPENANVGPAPTMDELYSYFDFLPDLGTAQRQRPQIAQKITALRPALDPIQALEEGQAMDQALVPAPVSPELAPTPARPSPPDAKQPLPSCIESVDLLGLDFSPRINVGPPPLVPQARPIQLRAAHIAPPVLPRGASMIVSKRNFATNGAPRAAAQARPAPSPAEKMDSVEQFVKGSSNLPPAMPGAPDNNLVKHILAEGVGGDPDSFFIDMSEVKFTECIGEGTSALVYKGMYRGTDVAVKKLKTTQCVGDSNFAKELKREITALAMLRHPNLVLFMGTGVLPEGNVCILTEFCDGGTLFQLLHAKKHVTLSWRQRAKIALDVAKGMAFLHSHKPPIIHRDLKSLNLLLSENVSGPSDYVHVKITDFGLARYQIAGQYMTGNAGTYVISAS